MLPHSEIVISQTLGISDSHLAFFHDDEYDGQVGQVRVSPRHKSGVVPAEHELKILNILTKIKLPSQSFKKVILIHLHFVPALIDVQ